MRTLISFTSFSDELKKIAEAKTEKVLPISKADHAIYGVLAKGSPVKINIDDSAAELGGGYFDQDKKEITLSEKNFKVLAHELGHAQIHEHFLGRLMQSKAARVLFNATGSALASAGVGILMAKGKKWGLLLPAAVAAPTILSEALATHKGEKLLEEAGATRKQREAYGDSTRKGLGTYFGVPLRGTLSGALIGSLVGAAR